MSKQVKDPYTVRFLPTFLYKRPTQSHQDLTWSGIPKTIPAWLTCILSLFSVFLAYLLQKSIWSLIPASPFLLFNPAIFLSAWLGGRYCGFAATLLSSLIIDYAFLPPYEKWNVPTLGNTISILVFICIGFVITIVIHRQKASIEQLKQSEEREKSQKRMYDALLDATNDQVYMFDQEKRFVFVNRKAMEITGAAFLYWGKQSNESLLGKHLQTAGYPENVLSYFNANLNQALSGKLVRHEHVFPTPSGPRTFEQVLSPLYGKNGQIEGVVGISRDIQDRKNIETKLHETAERFDLALKAGNIGVFEMDLQKPEIPVDWSDRQYEIFGFERDQGAFTYADFKSRIHPEDLPRINQEFEESLREKRDFNLTYRIRFKNGNFRWIQASARAFYDKGGNPIRMIGTNIDVTDQIKAQEVIRESEVRFRELAESMPQIVWASDPQGKTYYYNNQWFEYLGVPKSELQSYDGWNFVHPEDQEKVRMTWKDSVLTKRPFEIEMRMKKMDGTYHWFLSRALPIFDSEGTLIRWYGTLTNIDENKKVQDIISHALKAREEMLAIVSHDLRNPLGSILMSAAMIKRKLPHDDQVIITQANKIQKAGERMNGMIEDLLNLAKMESGNFTLTKKDICGCNIVTEAVEIMLPLAQEKNIRIETTGVDQPLLMSCDHNQVLRVFSNLIGNAIKFTSEQGLIHITAKDCESEVQFCVSDTGPGIAKHHIPHIFDRFWQAQKTQHMGTGLGLAISRGIVEAHGGKIWVESRFGFGASFFFTLPKAEQNKVNQVA